MLVLRVSAKAVIVRDDKLLVIVKRDASGEYYVLPGGGQETFETLVEAIIRECREELGTTVTIGELLYVRDYIGCHHEFAAIDRDTHQVELMFACSVPQNWVRNSCSASTLQLLMYGDCETVQVFGPSGEIHAWPELELLS